MATETKFIISAVDNTGTAVKSVVKGFDDIGQKASSLSGVLGGLTGVAATGLFAEMIRGSINAADNMNDLSQRTGMAVGTLASYKLAAEQSGASLDSIGRGAKELSVKLLDNADAFRKIGIDSTDVNAAMLRISDLFAAMPDGVEKSAMATRMFGKAGQDLIPMLNLGSEGLEASAVAAASYAAAMEQTAPQADQFNDTLAVLSMTTDTLAAQLAGAVLPTLNVIGSEMSGAAAKTGEFSLAAKVLKTVLETVAVLGANVAYVFNQTGREIGGWAAQIAVFLERDYSGKAYDRISEISKEMKSDAEAARKEIDALSERLLNPPKVTVPGVAEGESDKVKKLSEEFRKLYAALRAGEGSSSKAAAETERLAKALANLRIEENARIFKAAADELKAMAEADEKYQKSVRETLDPLEKRAEALEREVDFYGMTESKIEETIIARLEEQKVMAAQQAGMTTLVENLEKEIAARKRLAEAAGQKEYLDASKKASEEAADAMENAAKKADEAWSRTAESMGDSITDALMRGAEKGKDAFENLRDTVKNMFQAMVLRPVVQGAVVGGLSLLGMGSPSAMASDSSGIGNYLGLGNSAYGALSGNSLFGGMYTNFATSGLGSSLGLSTQVVGSTGVEAVGSMTSMGSSIGSALPWVAAAVAVLSMIDWGGGTPHKGGVAFSGPSGTSTPNTIPGIASAYGGTESALYGQFWESDWTKRFESSIADALKEPASGIASLLNTTAKTFNQQSGYTVGLAFSADGEDSSRGRLGILDAAGNEIAELIGKYSSDASAGMTEFLSATGAETRKALDAMDLPGWADGLLAALGDTPSLDNLSTAVTQINAIAAAAEQLAPAIGVTTDKFAELYTTLGLDALNTYYSNFYSEAERTAQATETLTKQISELGFALPESRDAFRELIESQDLTTDSGMEAYSALVQLSSAFAALVPSAETASETMRSLQAATETLQIELLKAQGDLTEAAEAQRAVDTSAMSEAELAIYDYNAALREQINALNSASAAASARLESQADRIDAYLAAQREAAAAAAEQALATQQSALNEQVSAAQRMADEFSGIVDSLTGFRQSMLTGSNSSLSTSERYAVAKQAFESTAALAKLGNVEAAGNLQASISEFLSASKDASASSLDYALDFAAAMNSMDSVIGTAGRQANLAEQSLQVAEAQLASLQSIAASVSGSTPGASADLPLVVDNFTQAMLDWESWFANTTIGQTSAYEGLGSTTRISDTKGIFTDTAGSSYVFSRDAGPYGLADQSAAWEEEMRRRYGSWKIPSYDVGTNYVPRDMLAMVHQGEAIIPRAYNPTRDAGGDDALVIELRAVRAELEAHREILRDLNSSGVKTADTLIRVTRGGQSMLTEAAA